MSDTTGKDLQPKIDRYLEIYGFYRVVPEPEKDNRPTNQTKDNGEQ